MSSSSSGGPAGSSSGSSGGVGASSGSSGGGGDAGSGGPSSSSSSSGGGSSSSGGARDGGPGTGTTGDAGSSGGAGNDAQSGADGAATACAILNPDQILAAQGLQEPQWYKDNIPFVDTPDTNINGVYYYRWSTHKRALRYTTAGAGYIATEYDNPTWYAGDTSYSGLSDAAGYHILDGRWLRNRRYIDEYINYWLVGAGQARSRLYSEWIASAAYRRYLVTGDPTQLKANLGQLIALYNSWGTNLTANVPVNGTTTSASLYFQSPLFDATEFTETSFRSTDAFGGGTGFRPTINSYQYAAALAISQIATLTGDTADATSFAAKAAALKAAVQQDLWDPQRQFFMHVYNADPTNVGIAGTRTTWREAMGFAPWAFELPDASFSTAWQYLTDTRRFAGPNGPYTLERFHDFEAEQAVIVGATTAAAATASNGQYVGPINAATSSVTFTVFAPGAGTYPVDVFYANVTGANATQVLVVNGATASPTTVTYPTTGTSVTFSTSQAVRVQVPMLTGANTLKFSMGTGAVSLDRIGADPYFDFQAIPAVQNHDDTDCCHWDGPTWPFDTSMILTGLANLLQDYPAQSFVTKQTYDTLLSQFATLQHKNGVPYVAEAADGDTGSWIYDASDFSENYNHSSFVDLVLTGLFGIKPQATDTVQLKPLVPDTWSYFAVQDVPYHGHLLTIVWDQTGTHYNAGSGLQVCQDGIPIYQSATLGNVTVPVAAPIIPPAATVLDNIVANAWTADQDWFKGWDNRVYTPTFPMVSASYTNTVTNGPRCRSADNPRCVNAFDTPLRAIDGFIRYDVMPDDRWTNSGSPNATDFLAVDFGQTRPMNEVKIYTYDDGQNIRVPQSYDVQYLSGTTWTSVPGQAKVPTAPVPNAPNEATFPAVNTSQFRVVFTPQAGKFVGVTELESWYPHM
ncbi:MAG TPA: discoidin domain-containing protein [Polyangiaceae bacterium]